MPALKSAAARADPRRMTLGVTRAGGENAPLTGLEH
jgi:hypothetical protein